MVNWNMTIGELVKKLNDDGIDLPVGYVSSDRTHPAWFSKSGGIDWEGCYGGTTGYGNDIVVKSASSETIIPYYNANRIPTKISYDILNTRKGD